MVLQRLDFRSDTVTQPCRNMRRVMADAAVGDDVYGEDPTVQELQRHVALMLGKEDALLFPSGTQSNLVAIMTHCGRGDEYIVADMAHSYRWEAGGAAVLGSVQPQPLRAAANGSIRIEEIAAAIKPDDLHFARTRLLVLENTFRGNVLPEDFTTDATDLARRRGLAVHLDGARLLNAAVASGRPASQLAENFDTVSLCLSKGLGAPLGSVLAGRHEVVETARRLRKMVGGGMRQAGIVAAAGLYALMHNVQRLALDHTNATRLATELAGLPGLTIHTPETNIVFVDVDEGIAEGFAGHLRADGIGVSLSNGGRRQRWVTHLGIDVEGIEDAIASVHNYFG